MTDLTRLDSHFAFGENWASYAAGIGDGQIEQAGHDLARLLGTDSLTDRTFLDIGCGSGLHSLAAIRMGARRVVACDLDPESVRTTRALLDKFAPAASYEVTERSVFDLSPQTLGTFDVVYSWGVLHHTGNLAGALTVAASMVAPGGQLLVALYRRTLLCPLWALEKQWYAKASPQQQAVARRFYTRIFRLALRLTGRNPETYFASYRSRRGMDFPHDVHDWLGGFPYESMSPDAVDRELIACGLQRVRSFVARGVFDRIGVLGSGCDEFAYRHRT